MSDIDPLTGLPTDFVRMLTVHVDPFNDTAPGNPNKPLDDFFRALMRVQVSVRTHGKLPGMISATARPKEGR